MYRASDGKQRSGLPTNQPKINDSTSSSGGRVREKMGEKEVNERCEVDNEADASLVSNVL